MYNPMPPTPILQKCPVNPLSKYCPIPLMGETNVPAPGSPAGMIRGLPTTRSQLSTVSCDASALFTGTCPVVSGWMLTSSLGSSVPTYKQPPAPPVTIPDVAGQPVASENTCMLDRKSTRLNSSHLGISYAVFC